MSFYATIILPFVFGLITVLLGQTLFFGQIFTGFITLFVFGLALTVPLAVLSAFKRGIILLGWIAERAGNLRIAGGIILFLIGVATLYSGSYWNLALLSTP